MYEIIYTENSTSKLTIAKDRCTVKITKQDKELGGRIIDFTEKIRDKIGVVENTLRGQFTLADDGYLNIILTKYKVHKEIVISLHEGEI